MSKRQRMYDNDELNTLHNIWNEKARVYSKAYFTHSHEVFMSSCDFEASILNLADKIKAMKIAELNFKHKMLDELNIDNVSYKEQLKKAGKQK